MDHLESFALEGLRTLMVGKKEMSNEEYDKWDEVRYTLLPCVTIVASLPLYATGKRYR